MKISDIIVGTAWPIHPASLAYALDLRIYYIKNKVDDKCFTKNILFINYIPLFIKEKCSEFFNTKHDTNLIIDLCLFALIIII